MLNDDEPIGYDQEDVAYKNFTNHIGFKKAAA